MDKTEAQAALAAMNEARAHVALVAECPPWRHAAFGAVMAAPVMALGVGQPIQSVLFAGSMIGVLLIARDDRRRTGMFVNGYRKGRTRVVSFGLLAVFLVMIAGEVWLRESGAALAYRIALAALSFVVAVWFSVVWSRIFKREMEEAA